MVWDSTDTRAMLVGAVVATLCFAPIFTYFTKARKDANTNITQLGGSSLLAAWPFFDKRSDFLWSNFRTTGQNIFRFRVLQASCICLAEASQTNVNRKHHVVAMHGEEARKVFFGDKGLDMGEGYRLLMGGSPRVEDLNLEAGEHGRQFFLKNLSDLFTKERLADRMCCVLYELNMRITTLNLFSVSDTFKRHRPTDGWLGLRRNNEPI
jgi:hypothetical protein